MSGTLPSLPARLDYQAGRFPIMSTTAGSERLIAIDEFPMIPPRQDARAEASRQIGVQA
jgi:hypothetical protein